MSTDATVHGLSDERLDDLWEAARPWMSSGHEEWMHNTLSGDDPESARSALYWLHKQLAEKRMPQEDVREFAVRALGAFLASGSKSTLGQAFGVERGKKGTKPIRAGAMRAIVALIDFLHDERGYPLAESLTGPNAFEVASLLLTKRWRYTRSWTTLRDHYQKQKKVG